MCKQLQCYYEECGHIEDYALLRCSYERRNPGKCRSAERPEKENDTGVCEECREYLLHQSGTRINQFHARLRDIYNDEESLEGDYHQRSGFNPRYQTSWQGSSRGGGIHDFSDIGSYLGTDGDDWEIIERSPTKKGRARKDSQDSWESKTMSDSSGKSGRSGRSDRSERPGRRSRR